MVEYFASGTGKYHLVEERIDSETVKTQCGLEFSPVSKSLNTEDNTFMKPGVLECCSNCQWDKI